MKCAVAWCRNPVAPNKNKYCAVHGNGGQCQISGCTRKATSNYSLCRYHYERRAFFLGDQRPPDKLERFMRKVWKRPDGCWEWIGGRSSHGYGVFNDGEGAVHAHSFIFALTYGHFPWRVGHTCGNRACVNPEHLYEYKRSQTNGK